MSVIVTGSIRGGPELENAQMATKIIQEERERERKSKLGQPTPTFMVNVHLFDCQISSLLIVRENVWLFFHRSLHYPCDPHFAVSLGPIFPVQGFTRKSLGAVVLTLKTACCGCGFSRVTSSTGTFFLSLGTANEHGEHRK